MNIRACYKPINALLEMPLPRHNGITGWRDVRFFAVLFCYALAAVILACDPVFGNYVFTYTQGIYPVITAALLMSAFCWENPYFGPAYGANFVLHIILIFPLITLIAILAGPAPVLNAAGEGSTLLGTVAHALKNAGDFVGITQILEWIPAWIREIFTHTRLFLLLIFTLLILCVPQTCIRLSLLLILFFLYFAVGLTDTAHTFYLLGGGAVLGLGLYIQYSPYQRIVVYSHILNKLGETQADGQLAELTLRLTKAILEKGEIDAQSYQSLVQSVYGTAPNTRQIAAEAGQKLMYELNIVAGVFKKNRFHMELSAECRNHCTPLLVHLCLWPRILFLSAVTLIWILLPIDIIPDPIPVIGVVDDASITGAAAWAIYIMWKKIQNF